MTLVRFVMKDQWRKLNLLSHNNIKKERVNAFFLEDRSPGNRAYAKYNTYIRRALISSASAVK